MTMAAGTDWKSTIIWTLLVGVWSTCTILASVAPAQRAVTISDEPHHRFVLKNQFFRVYQLELAAKAGTQSYTSKHDCLLIALNDADLLDNANRLQMHKGDPWPLAKNVAHSLMNDGDGTVQAIAIENLMIQLDEPPPKCDCKPESEGGACVCSGGGSGSGGDGIGHWVHAQAHGKVTIEAYGLQPIATFMSKDRPGPLPEMEIKPDAPGELFIAVDDVVYRSKASERSSILPRGTAMWIQQDISVAYPQPSDCSWDNFLIDGKRRGACKTSVFVLVKPDIRVGDSSK